jgi:hypothetical protein
MQSLLFIVARHSCLASKSSLVIIGLLLLCVCTGRLELTGTMLTSLNSSDHVRNFTEKRFHNIPQVGKISNNAGRACEAVAAREALPVFSAQA